MIRLRDIILLILIISICISCLGVYSSSITVVAQSSNVTVQPDLPEQQSYTGAIAGEIRTALGYSTSGGNVSLWLDGHLANIPNNPQESISQNYSGTHVDYVFEHLAPGRYTVIVPYYAGANYNDSVTVDVGTRPVRADIVLSQAFMQPAGFPSISFTPTVGEFVSSPQTSLSTTALPSTISRPTPALPWIVVVLIIGSMACLLRKKDRPSGRK